MLESQQLVLSNIEADVLVRSIRRQQDLLREVQESIEARDTTSTEVGEVLSLIEKNLKRVRKIYLKSNLFQ